MSMIYLDVRLNLVSPSNSIWWLVLGILQFGMIVYVATQRPYTWFLSFFRGIWALSVMKHCDGQCKHLTASITEPMKLIKRVLGTWKNLLISSFTVAYKTSCLYEVCSNKSLWPLHKIASMWQCIGSTCSDKDLSVSWILLLVCWWHACTHAHRTIVIPSSPSSRKILKWDSSEKSSYIAFCSATLHAKQVIILIKTKLDFKSLKARLLIKWQKFG